MNGFQSFRAKFGAAVTKAVPGESMWQFEIVQNLVAANASEPLSLELAGCEKSGISGISPSRLPFLRLFLFFRSLKSNPLFRIAASGFLSFCFCQSERLKQVKRLTDLGCFFVPLEQIAYFSSSQGFWAAIA